MDQWLSRYINFIRHVKLWSSGWWPQDTAGGPLDKNIARIKYVHFKAFCCIKHKTKGPGALRVSQVNYSSFYFPRLSSCGLWGTAELDLGPSFPKVNQKRLRRAGVHLSKTWQSIFNIIFSYLAGQELIQCLSKYQVLVHVMNLLIHFLPPGGSADHRMSREKTKNFHCLSWSLMGKEMGLGLCPEEAHDPVIIL